MYKVVHMFPHFWGTQTPVLLTFPIEWRYISLMTLTTRVFSTIFWKLILDRPQNVSLSTFSGLPLFGRSSSFRSPDLNRTIIPDTDVNWWHHCICRLSSWLPLSHLIRDRIHITYSVELCLVFDSVGHFNGHNFYETFSIKIKIDISCFKLWVENDCLHSITIRV